MEKEVELTPEELKKGMRELYYYQGFIKEDRGFRKFIDQEAKERGTDSLELLDYFADHLEEYIQIYPKYIRFLEKKGFKRPEDIGLEKLPVSIPSCDRSFYPIKTNPSIDDIFQIFRKLKNIERIIERVELPNNGYIELNIDEEINIRNFEKLLKLGGAIQKTFDFVLWKIGDEESCNFSCNLNEYFDWIGIKRRKENIEHLEDILKLLSRCSISFRTKINNEMMSGYGSLFAWSLVKKDEKNPYSKYTDLQIAVTQTWGNTIIANKFFIAIDHRLPKIPLGKFPYCYSVGRKLTERYRYNARRRKGKEIEIISIEKILEAMNKTIEEIKKKRDWKYWIDQVEKTLNELKERNIFEWEYRYRYKTTKDKIKGYIKFKPLKEEILKINKLHRKKLKDKKKKKQGVSYVKK
jgi:hypothetical protein